MAVRASEEQAARQGRRSTAERALVTTLVAGGVVVAGLALWKLRLVLALLLLAVTIAAAMRPGVEAMARRRIPRALGVILHYLVFVLAVGVVLSYVLPRLMTEVQTAVHGVRTAHTPAGGGLQAKLLDAAKKWLHRLPTDTGLIHPAFSAGEKTFEVVIGIFFTFAAAAYWVFERDQAIDLLTSFIPRPRRKKVRDTWSLIEDKLGAYVRGQLLLIVSVSTVLSVGLLVIGEPYGLLIGILSGFFEVVPVIGPVISFGLAIGAGLTVSWHLAAFAGAIVLAVRLLEDYLVTPHVLGGAVGLSPLVVLTSVLTMSVLFGGFYVILAIPLTSLLATIIDVVARGVEPSEVDVPPVLFPAKESET